MSKDLEERLDAVSEEARQELKASVESGIINRVWEQRDHMPYLKKDLSPAIANAILNIYSKHSTMQTDIAELSKYVYDTMNKEPLKRVWYGIVNCGTLENGKVKMPSEALSVLTPMEMMNYFAGLWHEKSSGKIANKADLARRTAYGIIVPRIKNGLEWIRAIHAQNDYKQPDGALVSYEDALLSLPETQDRIYIVKPKRTTPRIAPGQQLAFNFGQPEEEPVEKPVKKLSPSIRALMR